MFDHFLKAVVFIWIIVEAQGRDEAIAALSGKVKQMEARHSKAMEAAEEKFRKAFDRVKRAAVEAPWKQEILALRWWY